MDCTRMRRHVEMQEWKGLCIQHSEGTGTSIKAKRSFCTGEVVCDYHGAVVTTIDGQEVSSCNCHPKKKPPGKLIKYSSRKRANVRPKHCTFEMDGETRHVTLFLATRKISPNQEVLLSDDVKGTLE